MKMRMMTLTLLLSLLLTACGGGKQPQQGQVSSLEAAAEMDGDEILLTVDGREVPAWRYLYWLAYACQRVQDEYQQAALPLDWDTPVSGGTLEDYVRDQALADTVLYATVENRAKQYACTPSKTAALNPSALPDMGLDADRMAELEQTGLLYAALYDLYATEGSVLYPTQEALAAYGQAEGVLTLDRILIPMQEDREQAQRTAAEAFSKLNAAGDWDETFLALAAAGADTAGPRTVVPPESNLAPDLLEAAQALEEGQFSGILESEEGFSILRRLPLDAAALMDGYFDHTLLQAAEQAAVVLQPRYEKIDIPAFSAALEKAFSKNKTA